MDAAETLTSQPITASAWAPFGWLPAADTDPLDAHNALKFAWDDPHLNVISHTADEIERTATGLICDRLYRHATHTQALTPINVDSVLVVAPPGTEFGNDTDRRHLRVFRLDRFITIVLNAGTWHWGPFPLGAEPVNLLNLQGRGYERDNDCVDLALATGGVVEVLR